MKEYCDRLVLCCSVINTKMDFRILLPFFSIWILSQVLLCESLAPQTYFRNCLDSNNRTFCNSYHCYSLHHDQDLRHLDSLRCEQTSDCLNSETGFVCVHYANGKGYCECPIKFAYNATSCHCQRAKPCPYDNESICHGGMRCADQKCTCGDLSRTLFEPLGRFCVLPSDENDVIVTAEQQQSEKTFMIVLCVVGAFVCLAILAIVVYAVTENVTCAKGDYECEDEKQDGTEEHIAAWDMPSLDYLSEEQTMKYLKRHHHNNDAYLDDEDDLNHEVSPTPSGSGGSLPESDQVHSKKEHINMGFVHEDAIRRTSESHDV